MSKSGVPIVSDVAKAVKPIVQPIAKAIRPLAPILPFIPIPGMFGLSSLLTKSLLTGALGGLDKQGKFNVGRGVKSGLLAYGIGSLMQPAAAASGSAGAPMSATDFGSAVDSIDAAAGTTLSGAPAVDMSSGITSLPNASPSTVPSAVPSAAPSAIPSAADQDVINRVISGGGSDISTMPVSSTGTIGEGLSPPTVAPNPADVNLNAAVSAAEKAAGASGSYADKLMDYASQLPGKTLDYVTDPKNIIPVSLGATTAYGGIKSMQDLERQKKEAERILQNREKEKAEDIAYAESVLRDYPLLYKRLTEEDVRSMGLASGGMANFDDEPGYDYAYGGLAGLAGGGLPPRYLRGGGDGMSDSIRARIGGRQEARLADGEFVVPADVVSHIGNGSSNAGAKKLYAMMDRARQARTGRKRQAPAVKAERYMPA